MKMIRLVLAALVALVCAQIVCAANPLLVQVNCQGCSSEVGIPEGYKFYADVGKSITLTISSSGGIGSKSYNWMENGIIVCNRASFQLTVAEDNVEYALTVADDRGSVSKMVRIIPTFPQKSKCLPDFRGDIILRDEIRERTEYAAGDAFTLEVKLDRESCSDCPNYKFYWETDNPDIILVSPNSTKTEVKIKQGAKKSDAIVRAVITNGVAIRDREIDIEIVKNTPPQFKIEHSKPVYSYTGFEVWCVDFKPGEQSEKNDFLYKCSAVLKNEKGKVVSSASRTASRGKISSLKLKPEGIKVCFIELTAYDSHLASTTVNKTIQVVKGDTGKDIPIVRAPDIIYCIVGKMCRIDASETLNRDKNVSSFGFYDVRTSERLANLEGDYCSGPVCRHNFTYPGTYRIKITANYFDEDNIGSKIVTVIVSPGNVSITPTPTPATIPTSKPTKACVKISAPEEPETKKRSLEKFFSGIIAIIDTIKNALK